MAQFASNHIRTIRRGALVAAGAMLTLAGCSGNEREAAQVRLVNEPGRVELAALPNSAGNEVWTTFTIKESTHPTAIASPGTGGACLVADLNSFDMPVMSDPQRRCTKNSDCQGGINVQGTPTQSWAAYCDIDGDKKCWVRPGPQGALCKIGPQPQNVAIETPRFPLDGFKATYSGPVRWRAVACLNGYNPPNNRDCSLVDGDNRREVMGPPRAIP